MRIIIAGAGPAGFATAHWLTKLGHTVTLLEKRSIPGGKVSAWQDPDGDWVESLTALVETKTGELKIIHWPLIKGDPVLALDPTPKPISISKDEVFA